MRIDNFVQYLSTVPKEVHIHFSGFSEPWGAPDCGEMVRFASTKGHPVHMFTTLRNFDAQALEAVEDIPFRRFVLHIPDEEGMMQLTVDRNYLKILENLLKSKVNLTEIHCIGTPNRSILSMVEPYYPVLARQAHSRCDNVEFEGSKRARLKGALRCSASPELKKNVLLPNGDVMICCMDYCLEHTFGNLAEGSYAQLFESQSYSDMLQLQSLKDSNILCRRCTKCAQPTMMSKFKQIISR